MPIANALSAYDDILTEMDTFGYKPLLLTDAKVGDDVFFELSFSGLETTDNRSNPGVMPRLTLAMAVNYTHDFVAADKRLMQAVLEVYPYLISQALGQIDDERTSWTPDPDIDRLPARIGMNLTLTLRNGLVSYKD